MSLSDCEKCWNTPCVCGYVYRYWSPGKIDELIARLELVKKIQKDMPHLRDFPEEFSQELIERAKKE